MASCARLTLACSKYTHAVYGSIYLHASSGLSSRAVLTPGANSWCRQFTQRKPFGTSASARSPSSEARANGGGKNAGPSKGVFQQRVIMAASLVGAGLFGYAVQQRMAQNEADPHVEAVPIVISGPSGSGKSTLLKKLQAEFPEVFGFSVSHTTRKPRAGEEDGREYYFVTEEDFLKDVEDGMFVEHAVFSGNRYGTSTRSIFRVLKQNRFCILDVNVDGVKSMKAKNMGAKFIFVKPPSMETLVERLRKRGTESEESLKKRLAAVAEEMEYAKGEGNYDIIVVNDDLEDAYQKLRAFLIEDIKALQKWRSRHIAK